MDTTLQVKLSKQGQLTIPKKILKKLGLDLDILLNLKLVDDQIIISKKGNVNSAFNGISKNKIDLKKDEYIKLRKNLAKI
jgi:bifunctional DNA-binding transcriptional regulator/antitoxin component of YhaV-PrlF toxin-antitoxin module